MFVLIRICGCQNRWKSVQDNNVIKINQKINHAFWGSLGSLLGAFRDLLGLPGGRWGWFGAPFGRFWGCLGSALRILGIPGGSLGTPGLIFGFFLEMLGPLLAPFWHPFGTFFRLSGSVAFFIDFWLLLRCFWGWCCFTSGYQFW